MFYFSVSELHLYVGIKHIKIWFYSCPAAVRCWAAGLLRCVSVRAQAETGKLKRATSGKTRRPKPQARTPLPPNEVSFCECEWNSFRLHIHCWIKVNISSKCILLKSYSNANLIWQASLKNHLHLRLDRRAARRPRWVSAVTRRSFPCRWSHLLFSFFILLGDHCGFDWEVNSGSLLVLKKS